MTSLISINRDCFDCILSWCNSHQVCKLFWCGDVQLDRLLQTRPLDLTIRFRNSQQWPFSALICQSNIRSFDLQNDNSNFLLGEVTKLSKSLRHLSLCPNYNDTIPENHAWDKTIKLLLNVNISKSFPLMKSLSIGLNQHQLNPIPAEFLINLGNQMVHLNLYHHDIMLQNFKDLPKSLTFLSCFVTSRDNDVDIVDLQFPPHLSVVSLGKRFASTNFMTSKHLDCLIMPLPVSVYDLKLEFQTQCNQKFQYRLDFGRLVHLQSLSISTQGSANKLEFVQPLPIPPSATSVCYDISYRFNDKSVYPFESEPRSNLKELHLSGYSLPYIHFHLLPRNLETLRWGFENVLLTAEIFKFLPPKLQYCEQLSINFNKISTNHNDCERLVDHIQDSEWFQSQKYLSLQSATTKSLKSLPQKLAALHLKSQKNDNSKDFGFSAGVAKLSHLEKLCVYTPFFDLQSLVHVSAPRLHDFFLVTQIGIIAIPFTAPCFKYLTKLEVRGAFSKNIDKKISIPSFIDKNNSQEHLRYGSVKNKDSNEMSTFVAFRECLTHLKSLRLNRHSDDDMCPTWFFTYLPRSLVALDIDVICWQNDLVSDLADLPNKLESLLFNRIRPLSDKCFINVDKVVESLLPNVNFLGLIRKESIDALMGPFLSPSYVSLVKKLSCRPHLVIF